MDSNEQLPEEFVGRKNEDMPALFLTWGADNLYLSFTGNLLVDTDADLYLALDTTHDGTRTQRWDGSAAQPDVGPAANAYGDPAYPFAADVAFRFEGALSSDSNVQNPAPGEKYVADADGAWTGTPCSKEPRSFARRTGQREWLFPGMR